MKPQPIPDNILIPGQSERLFAKRWAEQAKIDMQRYAVKYVNSVREGPDTGPAPAPRRPDARVRRSNLQVIEALRGKDWTTIKEVIRLTKMSSNGARFVLNRLADQGILERRKVPHRRCAAYQFRVKET